MMVAVLTVALKVVRKVCPIEALSSPGRFGLFCLMKCNGTRVGLKPFLNPIYSFTFPLLSKDALTSQSDN